jgi:hypothetical protein
MQRLLIKSLITSKDNMGASNVPIFVFVQYFLLQRMSPRGAHGRTSKWYKAGEFRDRLLIGYLPARSAIANSLFEHPSTTTVATADDV